jgi:hypothetical protein
MNTDDLLKKFAAQRKWRERPPQKPRRSTSCLAILIFIVISAALLTAIPMLDAAYRSAATATPTGSAVTNSPQTKTSTPAVQVSPAAETITLKVCVENLHVRYTPDGSVRGYLKEGEQVTLAADKQGNRVTQQQNNETWILISIPVAGWVNEQYLCK